MVVLIVWLNSSAPTGYVSKVVIGLAVLLLVGAYSEPVLSSVEPRAPRSLIPSRVSN